VPFAKFLWGGGATSYLLHQLLKPTMIRPSSIVIILVSCSTLLCRKDVPVGPKYPPLGKRDYSWTADTLAYPGSPQTIMRDIWASSASDVYVVGENESPPGPGEIYHFDGQKWTSSKFHVLDGGRISGPTYLNGVYGFSQNDVWVVGERDSEYPPNSGNYVDSSLILHNNGKGWHEHHLTGGRALYGLWGRDSNDVWVGGRDGSLYRLTVAEPSKITFPSGFTIANICGFGIDSIYLRSYLQAQPTNVYTVLDILNGVTLTRIDTTQSYPAMPRFGDAFMSVMAPNIILTSGRGGVFQRTAGGWKNLLDIGNGSIAGIFASEANDIFAVGQGIIYQFNGNDWSRYTQFSDQNISWLRIWADGNEVFIVGFTLSGPNKTIILHGK